MWGDKRAVHGNETADSRFHAPALLRSFQVMILAGLFFPKRMADALVASGNVGEGGLPEVSVLRRGGGGTLIAIGWRAGNTDWWAYFQQEHTLEDHEGFPRTEL